MNNLSDENPLPYYQQLYHILRDEIVSGRWKPGDMMPSETEMIEQFDGEVDKRMCKKALRQVIDSGRLTYKYAGGSFISLPEGS